MNVVLFNFGQLIYVPSPRHLPAIPREFPGKHTAGNFHSFCRIGGLRDIQSHQKRLDFHYCPGAHFAGIKTHCPEYLGWCSGFHQVFAEHEVGR